MWWILGALLVGGTGGILIMAMMFMARDPQPFIPPESLSPMDANTGFGC